ncbi:RNA polymerase sigma factor [Bremerella volcania]|uniref:RNA polymerase sigma factor n=1 Tax=Bremerella volcania TaxID=2527984 RepID=A0A518CC53_9BACT|nr:RNA polymerase sigma factor [Bremerella volcania]
MNSLESESEKFVTLVTQRQRLLYGYIFSLVLNSDDAQEVLQETNLTLWRKRSEIPHVSHFSAWACRIAYYEVLAYRKRASRDRLIVSFDDELLGNLAVDARNQSQLDFRTNELRKCLERLPKASLDLLRKRYESSQSIEQLSKENGRSAASISQALYRIRRGLLACIKRQHQLETA